MQICWPIDENAVPSAENLLASLATMASASAFNGAIEWKTCVRVFVRAGKGITFVISN